MNFADTTAKFTAKLLVVFLALSALLWGQQPGNKTNAAPPPNKSAATPPVQHQPNTVNRPPSSMGQAPGAKAANRGASAAGGKTSSMYGGHDKPRTSTNTTNKTSNMYGGYDKPKGSSTSGSGMYGGYDKPPATTGKSSGMYGGYDKAPNKGASPPAGQQSTTNAVGKMGTTGQHATGSTSLSKSGTSAMGGNKSLSGTNATKSPAASKAGLSAGTSKPSATSFNTRQVQVGKNNVILRADGRPKEIRSASGTMIRHDIHGGRTIISEHNNRRIVSMGHHYGFVERPYRTVNGREYRLRSYYYGGRPYAVYYRPYYWHGYPYYGYAPYYYYRPAYYGWVYNPWPAPVYYPWGWYNDPWYRYYGYYYAPYPAYPSANLWLTDYILAENLRMAYIAGGFASLSRPDTARFVRASTNTGQMSPEAKQLLAEEVKQQIADERNAAAGKEAGQTPPALSPRHRTFLVSSNLDVADDNGGECGLTAGDVIVRTSTQPNEDKKVPVTVRGSKKGDCAVGTRTKVDVADLQEMYNHLHEQVDAGLKHLADNQGKNGLPAAPDTSTTGAKDLPPPTPDSNVDADLQNAQSEADQTEKEVAAGSKTGGGR